METIVKRAAGLDVHKAQVTACVRVPGRGRERVQEVAEFETTVRGLLALRDWLKVYRVGQVAMEATGVYCASSAIKWRFAGIFHGPGRDRTCDLGIKSPAERAATSRS